MHVLLTADQIRDRVAEVAADIRAALADRPVTVIGVLTGSLIFLSDLVRQLDFPLQIGLLKASSYRGDATTPGELRIEGSLLPDITGRHLLVLDDILDTGATLAKLVVHLKDRGAASVRTCVLLRKIGRQTTPFEPDYVGFTIPDKFVVGYGLDFNDEHRHLPFIGVLPDAGE